VPDAQDHDDVAVNLVLDHILVRVKGDVEFAIAAVSAGPCPFGIVYEGCRSTREYVAKFEAIFGAAF
jgi:hypothetical protein